MQKIKLSESLKFQNALRSFCEQAIVSGDVSDVVTGVLADVRLRGDSAVLQYTEKFDRARLTAQDMRVTRSDQSLCKNPQRRGSQGDPRVDCPR